MTTRAAFMAALMLGSSAFAAVAGESPRNLYFEFKLGPYLPMIDERNPIVVGAGTQEETVGVYNYFFQGQPMLMGEVELEYEVFQKFGTIGVGASVAYAEKWGKSRIDSANGGTTTTQAQSTGLMVVPAKVLATYRFDWLQEKFHVPLVPFLKVGFVAATWWSKNGANVEVKDGVEAMGVKLGIAGTVGLALCLDFLDQRLSRDFDTAMGVNHTYLTAEFNLQEVNSFGQPGLDFSSRHALFGIAFEF